MATEVDAQPTYSTKVRVLAVTAIIVGAFGLFNLVYLPLWRSNALRQPENFIKAAEHYARSGDREKAVKLLKTGINLFHPPLAKPYALLSNLEENEPVYKYRATIYEWIAQRRFEVSTWQPALSEAITQKVVTIPAFSASREPIIRTCARDLAGAWSAPYDWSTTLSYEMQAAFLCLSYGVWSSEGTIGTTGVQAPVDLVVQSGGGQGDQRTVHIFVGGDEYALRRRGLHVVLLEPTEGKVMNAGYYDLWADAREAERLTQVLADAPMGIIGLFGVYDEASENISHALEVELQSFGLYKAAWYKRRPAFYGLRWSFAAIGVKGAPQGSALQTWCADNFEGTLAHPVVCAVFVEKSL